MKLMWNEQIFACTNRHIYACCCQFIAYLHQKMKSIYLRKLGQWHLSLHSTRAASIQGVTSWGFQSLYQCSFNYHNECHTWNIWGLLGKVPKLTFSAHAYHSHPPPRCHLFCEDKSGNFSSYSKLWLLACFFTLEITVCPSTGAPSSLQRYNIS